MINIYTDGSCRPTNPGPSSFAVIAIFADGSIASHAEAYHKSTNNRMELLAAIRAVEMYAPQTATIHIHTDSMYVAFPISSGRLLKKKDSEILKKPNPDLWLIMKELLKVYKNIKVSWVRGHSGDTYNEMVDQLATEAFKSCPEKKKDHGYGKNLQSRLDKRNLDK